MLGAMALSVQVFGWPTSFLPSGPTIESMMVGAQYMPFAPMVAIAAAIVSGAISFVPRIEAGWASSLVPVLAGCTPSAVASLRMSQRSSFWAIPTNAAFTDAEVALRTLIDPPSPGESFLGVYVPANGPPHAEALKLDCWKVRTLPLTVSLSPWPFCSQSMRVKIL